LTDLALEALAGANLPSDSVETELKLWHALEAELERDRRWQGPNLRHGEVAPVDKVLRQVVRRAAWRVAFAMDELSDNQGRRGVHADEYLSPV
jgi:hypothetical protein